MDVREFERHLSSLREQGYRSILPADLVAAARWGRPLPRKPVVITFDDGLLGLMKFGEPLLAKYGFRAIAYIVTDLPAVAGDPRKNYGAEPALTWPEIDAVRKEGFRAATICEDEMASLRSDMDLRRIPRISVYGGGHRFSVEPVPSAAGDVVYEGRNDGLPVLRAAATLGAGESLRVELWDSHRTLRLCP